jgi:Cu/Zn superoxide dismutase
MILPSRSSMRSALQPRSWTHVRHFLITSLCCWGPPLAALIMTLILSSCAPRASSTVTTLTLATSRQTAHAELIHAPVGVVTLHWEEEQQVLLITVGVNGLAPNSRHPVHLHAGSCAHPGKLLVTLPTLIANQAGQAALAARVNIAHVGGLPPLWLLNIHNGPILTAPQGMLALACAPVTRRLFPTPRHDRHILLQGTAAPNEAARGIAHLVLERTGVLTLSITVRGLVALSHHAVHVHAGSCEAQGKVLFALAPLIANRQGIATEQARFPTGCATS